MEPAASRRCLRLAALALLLLVANCQEDTVPELTPGLRKDREGLLALKSKMTSFGNSQVASWRASGNPCLPTPWPSVKCSSGNDPRVTEIDLSNRGVAGTLSVGLRKAGRLEVINLQGNKFTGTIPNDWAKGNTFTRLRVLNIADNELKQVLTEVNWNRKGAFRSLEVLDLSGNLLYKGLPANWFGKYRPLRNVKYLDLSNNKLGFESSSGTDDYYKDWCETSAAAGLKAGSGWCPTTTPTPPTEPVERDPLPGTADSLITLNLANNGFLGEVPSKWPKLFPRLQYLSLQFNKLGYWASDYDLSADYPKPGFLPSVLPQSWTEPTTRGFPALSVLTLYPGNDYLCSVPKVEDDPEKETSALTFQDPNLDATYQVVDVNGNTYGDGNPWLCPTYVDSDNKPTITTTDKDEPDGWQEDGGKQEAKVSWTYPATVDTKENYVWGFKLTILGQDGESGEFSPLDGWNGALLRIYVDGRDDVAALDPDLINQGLACERVGTEDKITCTLTFADIDKDGTKPEFGLPVLDFKDEPADVPKYRFELMVINLNGVASSMESAEFTNIATYDPLGR